MAKIDLARRAEIGREKRARTRAQIVEAGAMLLAERPLEALTVDVVVETAGVAKGTFYYHFQSLEELAAAVGEKLGESFDELLGPARLSLPDPVARVTFGLTEFLAKALADPIWARLVVQSAHARTEFARSIRENLKTDLNEVKAQGRMAVQDVELAHRHGHLAAGHARHAPAAGRPRLDAPGSRCRASSHRRAARTTAPEGWHSPM